MCQEKFSSYARAPTDRSFNQPDSSPQRASSMIDDCQFRFAYLIIATRVADPCLLAATRSIIFNHLQHHRGVIHCNERRQKGMKVNNEETRSAKIFFALSSFLRFFVVDILRNH